VTLLDDQPWRKRAACRDQPMRLFFAETGYASVRSAAEARHICNACPVREECLQYALSDPDIYGIWGGLTRKERLAERRRQRRDAA
jgi:WhiB family redox-sensing transcriptional regulator